MAPTTTTGCGDGGAKIGSLSIVRVDGHPTIKQQHTERGGDEKAGQ